MGEIKKEQLKAIIISLIAVVLGVLFIVLKSEMLGALQTVVCFALLIYGIIEILIYCFLNTENRDYSKLIFGAIATVLALLLIFVNILFVIILGIIVAVSGVAFIKSAVDDKKAGDKQWWITLIIGILFLVLGVSVAILYNIDVLKNIIMIIFGATLIFEGVMGFVFVFILHKVISLNFVKKEKTDEESEEDSQENTDAENQIQLNTREEKSQKEIKNIEKIEEKPAKMVKMVQKTEKVVEEIDPEDDGGFI